MESVQQNSKRIVKYHFRVILEDEEEEEKESLLMDSWIYLDLKPHEEMPYDRTSQITDKNHCDDIPEKLGGELKQPKSDSFPVISSPCISQSLPSTSSQDDTRTFHVSTSVIENCTDETTYMNVSEKVSSLPPLRYLCNNTETRKHSTDVYNVNIKNTAETPDNNISEPYSSMEVDSTTNTDEASIHLPDVNSSKVKSAREIPHTDASKLLLPETSDSVVNPKETCRNYTDVPSVDRNTGIPSVKKEDTTESISAHVSKSFLPEAGDSVVNPNETCRNYTDVSSVNGKCTHISSVTVENMTEAIHTDAFKSFLHDAGDSVVNPNETCRNYTDVLIVKVESSTETIHTPVSKSFVPATFDSNMCAFMETEADCHSEGQTTPATSKQQKRNFSDDGTVIIISDDEDSDDCDIVYIGSCQSSNSCDASKHEKPSVDKMKCDHKNKQQTNHAPATNDDSSDDIIIYEEKSVPKLTDILSKPEKAMNCYRSSDIIIDKIVPTISEPKVKSLVTSKPGTFRYRKNKRKTHHFTEISVAGTDSAKNKFVNNKHGSNSSSRCVPRFWQESDLYPIIKTRDY